jgi:hypothetical protein
VLSINGSIADGMAHIAAGATLNGGGTINFQIAGDVSDLITVKGTLDISSLTLALNVSGTQTLSEYVIANFNFGGASITGANFASVTGLPSGTIDYDGTIANPNAIVWIPTAATLASITVTPGSGSRTGGSTVDIDATPNDGTYTIASTTISGYGWSQTGISNGLQNGANNDKTGTLTHNTINSINGDNQGRFSFAISGASNGTANATYGYTLTNTVAGNVAPYGAVDAFGTTQTATILSGNKVEDYSVNGTRNTGLNQLGNTFTIETSEALTADTDLTMAIRRRVDGGANDEVTAGDANFARFDNSNGKLFSDVVNINGIDGKLYLLTISYDESDLGAHSEDALRLGWLNTDINKWVIAVLGNTGGSYQDLGVSSWTTIGTLDSEDLGKFGVDTTNNYVWAVLNHNSSFAVIPEPTSLALLGLGAAGLLTRRRSPGRR